MYRSNQNIAQEKTSETNLQITLYSFEGKKLYNHVNKTIIDTLNGDCERFMNVVSMY